MSLSHKSLESLTENDLQALVDNQVAESKIIEYKQDLKIDKGDDKKEFLYDVSSFANASGGHLIFGIQEINGIATNVCGVNITADIDSMCSKIENIIRSNIDPRIPGLTVRAILLQNTKVAFVIYIPKSFAQPHMVTFNKTSKFYSRHSTGKYLLDVGELRTAFTLSQNLIERIRDFRRERLSAILADETPVLLNSGAKLVLHIIPINAFDPAHSFSITDINRVYDSFPQLFEPLQYPPLTGGWFKKVNFDGLVTFPQDYRDCKNSYLQIFKNGIIELVDRSTVSEYKEYKLIFIEYESLVIQGIKNFIEIQRELTVNSPLLIMLSLLGVKDYRISLDVKMMNEGRYPPGLPVDRDNLVVPEIMVEDFNFDISQAMKPIFDSVWNAVGLHRSYNYDENGNWVGKNIAL